MPQQHGFDLAGLDAESADLDLVVRAPQVLQLAGRRPPHAVTGAVHAAFTERVSQEPLRGQAWPS